MGKWIDSLLLLVPLLFVYADCFILEWQNATVVGTYGFAPTQEISLGMELSGASLAVLNRLGVSVDIGCNGNKVLMGIAPNEKSSFAGCLNGASSSNAIDVYMSNTNNKLTSTCFPAESGSFHLLELQGVNATVQSITTSIQTLYYSCVFMNNASSPSVQVTAPQMPVCRIPELGGVNAGEMVPMVALNLQVEDGTPVMVQGPVESPKFEMQPYWQSAALPTSATFTMGQYLIVSGAFITNNFYFCKFTANNETFESPEGNPEIGSTTLNCQITHTFDSLKRGDTITLVGVQEQSPEENITRELLFAASTPLPQFPFDPEPENNSSGEKPFLNSWRIVLIVVLPIVVLALLVFVIIGVAIRRYKRHKDGYHALPN